MLKKKLTERQKDGLFGVALILPTFLVFVLVILYPILHGIVMSFSEYTFFTVNKGFVWNHFANYKKIFADGFGRQLLNTLVFTLGTVGLELVLGMGIALLLNDKIKGKRVLRSLFLMPWTIPSIVAALLWSWLFQPQYGIIDYVLNLFRLISDAHLGWTQSTSRAMVAVVLAYVWRQMPYMLIMILAGLQSVRQDLVEAAAIDGATGAKIFFRIKLPAIRPVLVTALITCVMNSFQQFTIIYNMTAGGPVGATTTLSIAAYCQAFSNYDLGAGAAIGVIWLLLLGGGITFYNIRSKRFDAE